MPRRTRSQLLGKRAQREQEQRVESLQELARELMTDWRRHRHAAGGDIR